MGNISRDLFSEVEIAYVNYLQSKLTEIHSAAKKKISSISSKAKYLYEKLKEVQSSNKKEIELVNKQLLQSTQSLSSLKQSVIKSNDKIMINSNSIYEKELELEKKKRSNELSDKLARQMGSL